MLCAYNPELKQFVWIVFTCKISTLLQLRPSFLQPVCRPWPITSDTSRRNFPPQCFSLTRYFLLLGSVCLLAEVGGDGVEAGVAAAGLWKLTDQQQHMHGHLVTPMARFTSSYCCWLSILESCLISIVQRLTAMHLMFVLKSIRILKAPLFQICSWFWLFKIWINW